MVGVSISLFGVWLVVLANGLTLSKILKEVKAIKKELHQETKSA